MTWLVLDLSEVGFPVSVSCRVPGMPRSMVYNRATRLASARQVADEALLPLIEQAHGDSRGTYGAPRVHAELRLGMACAASAWRA